MKLSGKGLVNVFYHQSLDLDIDSYDFKPEDLTGAVVLTVEEAKFLHQCCVFLSGFDDRYCVEGAKDFARKLSKRIEQAEKQK